MYLIFQSGGKKKNFPSFCLILKVPLIHSWPKSKLVIKKHSRNKPFMSFK